MEPLSTHFVYAAMILVVVLAVSQTFLRVLGIMISDMQDKTAKPRFQKAAFTACIVLAFGTVYMVQPQWFNLISTPLAVAGAWGLVKLNSLLTDRLSR